MTKQTKKKTAIKAKSNQVDNQESNQPGTLKEQRPEAFKIERGDDGNYRPANFSSLTREDQEQKIINTFGVGSIEAGFNLVDQIARVAIAKDRDNHAEANAMFSLVNNINPQDDIEAMLVTQMVAVHSASMQCAYRANLKEQTLEMVQFNINSLVKLNRTFTAQMDSLNKHRGKGQQKMTVEHVHVNEGGQAIIGNVNQQANSKGGRG